MKNVRISSRNSVLGNKTIVKKYVLYCVKASYLTYFPFIGINISTVYNLIFFCKQSNFLTSLNFSLYLR